MDSRNSKSVILVDISDQDDDQLKKLPSIVLDADCRKSIDIFLSVVVPDVSGFLYSDFKTCK